MGVVCYIDDTVYPNYSVLKRKAPWDKDDQLVCFIYFESRAHSLELPEETASCLEKDGFYLEDITKEEAETYFVLGVAETLTPWEFLKKYIRAGYKT